MSNFVSKGHYMAYISDRPQCAILVYFLWNIKLRINESIVTKLREYSISAVVLVNFAWEIPHCLISDFKILLF